MLHGSTVVGVASCCVAPPAAGNTMGCGVEGTRSVYTAVAPYVAWIDGIVACDGAVET